MDITPFKPGDSVILCGDGVNGHIVVLKYINTIGVGVAWKGENKTTFYPWTSIHYLREV